MSRVNVRKSECMKPTIFEICAGAGGQALGIDLAGFEHIAAVEIDHTACDTLRLNRPSWNILQQDIRQTNGKSFRGVDLFAGGVPCPPFSIAGKQLGSEDERDLFPEAVRLVEEMRPRAVMLENVPGFASKKFQAYREGLMHSLSQIGYDCGWRVFYACDFGVPQLRPRFILVAVRRPYSKRFKWPKHRKQPQSVGGVLQDLMCSRGWKGAKSWAKRANDIAPTLVGGSKKHGGPDLGPTRARKEWEKLGVDGLGVADFPPDPDFPEHGMPRLTVRMAARIQGFPDSWEFSGRKTASYRQVGNAFPPPVANAVARAIKIALEGTGKKQIQDQPALNYIPSTFEFLEPALATVG